MKILGFTSLFHDSSACLLVDGKLIGYAEEERFNRKKHTSDHPQHAIDWLLSEQGTIQNTLGTQVLPNVWWRDLGQEKVTRTGSCLRAAGPHLLSLPPRPPST